MYFSKLFYKSLFCANQLDLFDTFMPWTETKLRWWDWYHLLRTCAKTGLTWVVWVTIIPVTLSWNHSKQWLQSLSIWWCCQLGTIGGMVIRESLWCGDLIQKWETLPVKVPRDKLQHVYWYNFNDYRAP